MADIALFVKAGPACEKHSILFDLGNESYLKDVYDRVVWQTGTHQLTIPKWIQEISLKMEPDRAHKDKLDALIAEVGKNEATAYLAAATLLLMNNFKLVLIVGIGQQKDG